MVKLQGGAGAVCTRPTPYTTSPGKEIVMPLQYTPAQIDQFWRKVDKSGDCWLWRSILATNGYGRSETWLGGVKTRLLAHRVAYELARGPIPDGLTLDHLCRIPACVNPSHLEPVSVRTNTLRGVGPTAQNAQKETCSRGHSDWQGRKDGGRRCATCHSMTSLASQKRRREAARALGVEARDATTLR